MPRALDKELYTLKTCVVLRRFRWMLRNALQTVHAVPMTEGKGLTPAMNNCVPDEF